jgi:hypothetical protein
MKFVLALPVVVAAAGLGIGWFSTPALPTTEQAEPSATPPQAVHAKAVIEDAARRFGAYDEPDVAPAPQFAEAEAPPPPPPDIAEQFRRDLTAVVSLDRGQGVWIVDESTAARRRLLHVGDVYKDGWRVRAIDTQSITIRKGQDRREIRVTDVLPDIVLAEMPQAAEQTVVFAEAPAEFAAPSVPPQNTLAAAEALPTSNSPDVIILPRQNTEQRHYRSAGERPMLIRPPGRGT